MAVGFALSVSFACRLVGANTPLVPAPVLLTVSAPRTADVPGRSTLLAHSTSSVSGDSLDTSLDSAPRRLSSVEASLKQLHFVLDQIERELH